MFEIEENVFLIEELHSNCIYYMLQYYMFNLTNKNVWKFAGIIGFANNLKQLFTERQLSLLGIANTFTSRCQIRCKPERKRHRKTAYRCYVSFFH